MKHIKIISLIIAVVLIACVLCSCGYEDQLDYRARMTMECYAIPGAYVDDFRGEQGMLIEEDDYGRKLFAVSSATDGKIHALCISQKADDTFVYYYDNICYRYIGKCNVYSEKELAVYEDDMPILKKLNDWNKPFNEVSLGKLVKRELNDEDLRPSMEWDEYFEPSFLEEIVLNHIKYDENNERMHITICDNSTNGKVLYVIRIYERNAEGIIDNINRSWFMILNYDDRYGELYDEDNFLMEIDDFYNNNDELAQIKEANGWES